MGIADRTPPTAEQYDRWRTEFCNWGRWGDDDELGTLNFVTPEVRRAAAALVQDGRAVSCSRPIVSMPRYLMITGRLERRREALRCFLFGA